MHRTVRLALGALALLLLALLLMICVVVLSAARRSGITAPAYTPSMLVHSIKPQSSTIGRTISMRGILFLHRGAPKPGSLEPTIGLRDAVVTRVGPATTYAEIDIALGPPNPILDALRRIPLLNPIVPATADHPIVGRPATYRLRLIRCAQPSCTLPLPAIWQLQDGG